MRFAPNHPSYDRQRFEDYDEDTCMACGAHGPDKRNLFVDCSYEIQEYVPEAINLKALGSDPVYSGFINKGFYLRICKHCRHRFLEKMASWFDEARGRRNLDKSPDGTPLLRERSRAKPVQSDAVREDMILTWLESPNIPSTALDKMGLDSTTKAILIYLKRNQK